MAFKKVIRKIRNLSSHKRTITKNKVVHRSGLLMRLEQLEPRVLLSLSVTDLTTLTAHQLAQSLVGAGVQISDAVFTGADVAAGSFTGGLSEGLGVDSGVMLSTGDIANAIGPNDADNKGQSNNSNGDTDLDALVPGYSTNDAAVLEFDFVPTQSTLSFQYVFASEEYNEYVDSSYNDVFGFFVNGQNIALIPGTTTPVAINNLNNSSHSAYFRDNDYGDHNDNPPYPTQFDGFTSTLQAVANVTAGQTTHIKLAIADAGDSALDSGVFLAGASFVSGSADISLTQTISESSVQVGESFVYTITATNNSATSATGVVISDTLPTSGINYIGAAASQGSISVASGVVNASLGTIAAGQSATLYITAQGAVVGSYDNSPFVSGNEYDPNTANNTDTDSLTVTAGSNTAKIQGSAWTDTNANGLWDYVESGMAGVVVYIDANGNDTLDATEQWTVTNVDNVLTQADETGTYSIEGLAAGTYTVKQVVPSGYTQTAAPASFSLTAGATGSGKDFGNTVTGTSSTGTISGVKFIDLNGNGVRDGGLIQGTLPDAVFVIDISGSTTGGFQGTPVGNQNPSVDGSSDTILDAEIAGFIALNNQLIAQGFGTTGKVAVVSFSDGATNLDMDPSVAGTQIYTTPSADNDGDGVLDVEAALRSLSSGGGTNYEPALQKATDSLVAMGTASSNGNVIFLSDGVPNYQNYADDVTTLKATGANVRAFGVGTGATLSTLQTIDTSAAIFTSTNELLNVFSGAGAGGGTTSYTEDGMAGVTIYLDLNDDGVLGSGEPSTITAADGSFSFTGLTSGQTYVVCEVVPAGYTQTSGPYTIVMDTTPSTDLGIGNMPTSTTTPDDFTISGWKFNDLDGDGLRDPNEPGLENWEIFLDYNANGTLDYGEEWTLTESDGYFEFTDMDSGTYRVAEVVQTADWYQTYPGSPNFPAWHTVTISPSDGWYYVTGLLFGNHEKIPSNISTEVISGTKFDDLNGNGIRDGGLIQGTDPDAVFIIDVSGSTRDIFIGTPVGDLNGNGVADTVLDAEIAGFIALNQQLVVQGFGNTARVAVVSFASSATNLDMDPAAAGTQYYTTPLADTNNNGILDVEEALKSLVSSGGTDYETALQAALTAYNNMSTSGSNGNIIFLSDGEPNYQNYADDVTTIKATGANVRAFGVGTGATLSTLQQIDAGAQIFTSTNELLNVFSGAGTGTGGTTTFTEPGLGGVTIYIDLDGDGTRDAGEPYQIAGTDGSYTFSGLIEGATYVIREEVPAGYIQTSGPHTVTIGEDSTLNLNFGNMEYEEPPADLPDLLAKSLTCSGGSIVVPGDKLTLSFIISNVGAEAAVGPVNLYFYASADAVLDALDTEIGSLTNQKVNLDPGEDSKAYTLKKYVISSTMLPADMTLFAKVEAADTSINETNLTNNTTSTDMDVRWRFGSWDNDGDGVLDRKNVKLTVNDASQVLCKFSMSGAGYGELDGPNFNLMTLNNSTVKSKVAIKTTGGGTTIEDITCDGDLGSLKASTTNLGNSFSSVGTVASLLMNDAAGSGKQIPISIGSVIGTSKPGKIGFHQIKNVTFSSQSALGSLTFAEWLDDGAADTITALSIGKLEAKGDKKGGLDGNYEADATISDANSTMSALTVNGLMDGSVRTAGSIKTVKLVAAVDSTIFAGIDSLLGLPTSGITNPAASINSVKMGGKKTIQEMTGNAAYGNHSYANTNISAPSMGSISLIGVQRSNSGTDHGLAGETFKSIKVTQPDKKGYSWDAKNSIWKTSPTETWGDFTVNLL